MAALQPVSDTADAAPAVGLRASDLRLSTYITRREGPCSHLPLSGAQCPVPMRPGHVMSNRLELSVLGAAPLPDHYCLATTQSLMLSELPSFPKGRNPDFITSIIGIKTGSSH